MESSVQDMDATPGQTDHDAVRAAVGRARKLYDVKVDPAAVAAVTKDLQGHLDMLIPTCAAMAGKMPATEARRRMQAAVATAEHLLESGPGDGLMSTVVHMQLLADSVQSLASCAKATA